MSPRLSHRTWAEIDPSAFRHNFAVARELVGTNVLMMAVVKANAYGHGVRAAVEALREVADYFGVANVTEALEVRELLGEQQRRETPVFILGPALASEHATIAEAGCIPSISTLAEAESFSRLGERLGKRVLVHLILDTGMGRIGLWEDDAVDETARAMAALPGITVAGIGSHLPVADEDEAFSREQIARFHALAAHLRVHYFREAIVHVENSAGVLGFPAQAGDLVRPGLMLYGSAPLAEWQPRLRAALTWKTRITLLRDVGAGRGVSYGRTFITERAMRLATLAVGYADGFRRHLSGCGWEVLIGGKRCAVLGRVTMDQIVVDVSAVPEAQVDDEVVLLGRQGEEEILAAEMAERAGTIAWDIFTGLGHRVVREVLSARRL